MAISHINLTKEIPTLISFARNDGWNYNTKIYISKKNYISHNKKKPQSGSTQNISDCRSLGATRHARCGE